MRGLQAVLFAVLVCQTAPGQVAVTSTEQISLPGTVEWLAPRFGPDGEKVYLTSTGYTGIWEYTLGTSGLRQLSADRRAGYGFAISRDGKQIAYRRVKPGSSWRDRQEEMVLVQVPTGKSAVQETGRNLSLPTFAGQTLAYTSERNGTRVSGSVKPNEAALLGIEQTKIAVLIGGRKILLDPLSNGSYIWPALSPDGTRIVAYDMSRGTFVCDLNGTILARLGRRDAPAWTRDGKWIVCVNEEDDGHRILSSDLFMISADGRQSVRLTDTPDVLEMNPHCSPSADRVVYNTAEGKVMVLTYSAGGR